MFETDPTPLPMAETSAPCLTPACKGQVDLTRTLSIYCDACREARYHASNQWGR